ncbi:hypothetical protein GUITHDRAFT_112182 [Guillardia theta CCMP2712]|uniref:Uncharacterized protein n=1 Tax=Guillardia theta (strain CCMP2712) TaxID=905079 RepID=L1J109_GUITC|nr:hypothetical protein GUITHDRAFT_112182 [Guillardia theta CCMP2712]EKX41765.1 hypothetical protein GUITHDRAFT_112182 [Guillardia theta CCMP2712]|eukprot:XP_005828745.1 hypothetical protein GUITHDRAFT_112182 [Guillardia theta CCMP2712]
MSRLRIVSTTSMAESSWGTQKRNRTSRITKIALRQPRNDAAKEHLKSVTLPEVKESIKASFGEYIMYENRSNSKKRIFIIVDKIETFEYRDRSHSIDIGTVQDINKGMDYICLNCCSIPPSPGISSFLFPPHLLAVRKLAKQRIEYPETSERES